MKFEKEYAELYGFILGDGTFRDARWKSMTFYNFNLNLIEYVKAMIEKVSDKKINILSRRKNNSIEYSINFPSIVTKKLVELNFNKKRLPKWILNSKQGIHFLKAFFECEGSLNHSQIMIYQADRKILKDCVKVANRFSLSAHVHNSSKNRKRDFYLAVEDVERIKKLFGKTIKTIIIKKVNKGSYHHTKRELLKILNKNKYMTTSEIMDELGRRGIKISRISNSLLNKHLKPLNQKGFIHRKKGYLIRNSRGMFSGVDSKWKFNRNLSKAEILNYPYGI